MFDREKGKYPLCSALASHEIAQYLGHSSNMSLVRNLLKDFLSEVLLGEDTFTIES